MCALNRSVWCCQAFSGSIVVSHKRVLRLQMAGQARRRNCDTSTVMSNKSDNVSSWSSRSWHTLDFDAGSGVAIKEVKSLESILKSNPDDTTARILLMGYFASDARNPQTKAYRKYLDHLLWFTEHQPWHDQLVYSYSFFSMLYFDAIFTGQYKPRINESDNTLKREHFMSIENGWKQPINTSIRIMFRS